VKISTRAVTLVVVGSLLAAGVGVLTVVGSAGPIGISTTPDGSTAQVEPDDASVRQWKLSIERCGAGDGMEACFAAVSHEALERGALPDLLTAFSIASGATVDACTNVFRAMGSDIAVAYPTAWELVTATDIRACNNSAAESGSAALIEANGVGALAELAATCVQRLQLTDPAKTPACAKGLGWGVAASEGNELAKLELCRQIIADALPATSAEDVSFGFDRLHYGCANAVMIANHGPTNTADSVDHFDQALSVCQDDALRTVGHRYEQSARNGCAGGVGASYGQRLAGTLELSAVNPITDTASSGAARDRRLEQLLQGCQTLEQPDGSGAECAVQVFRQAAYRLFSTPADTDKICALAAGVDAGHASRCREEGVRFNG
jgi:hypothetical protein